MTSDKQNSTSEPILHSSWILENQDNQAVEEIALTFLTSLNHRLQVANASACAFSKSSRYFSSMFFIFPLLPLLLISICSMSADSPTSVGTLPSWAT